MREKMSERTAKINITLNDKIGLGPPSYSKIEVGVSVTREINDPGGDEALSLIKAEVEKVAKEVVEPFIAEERAKVLKWVQNQQDG